MTSRYTKAREIVETEIKMRGLWTDWTKVRVRPSNSPFTTIEVTGSTNVHNKRWQEIWTVVAGLNDGYSLEVFEPYADVVFFAKNGEEQGQLVSSVAEGLKDNTTTQQTPQWAIDAAKEYFKKTREDFKVLGGAAAIDKAELALAAIIARHAPRHGASFNDLHRYATERDVRIAELERNNEALRIENERLALELDRVKTRLETAEEVAVGMFRDRDRTIEALVSAITHLWKSEATNEYTKGFCEVIARAYGDRK